jgi:hypothetical protein
VPHSRRLTPLRSCISDLAITHISLVTFSIVSITIKSVSFSPRIFPKKKKQNPAKMSLTNCRFYEDKYPEVDSFVMVNVKQVWMNWIMN